MSKKYCIYAHINKTNGKAYIGITALNPKQRWGKDGFNYRNQVFYYAIKKYGWNGFDHLILEKDIPESEISFKERFYIEKYDSFHNGYNCSIGGIDVSIGEKVKNRDRYFRQDRLDNFYETHKGKPVICVNTGEIFESTTKAAEKYNVTSVTINAQCRNRKNRTTLINDDGWYLLFRYYFDDIEYDINELRKESKSPIICLNDNTIYCNISEAARVLKLWDTGIGKNCNDKCGPINGLDFMYYKEYEKYGNNKKFVNNLCTKIVLVNTGEIFNSILEASIKYGLSPQAIQRCCNRPNGVCINLNGDNYAWQYYEDYLISPKNIVFDRPHKTAVHCITTDMYFDSFTKAGEYYNIDRHDISDCCKNKRTYCGYDNNGNPLIWEYAIPI